MHTIKSYGEFFEVCDSTQDFPKLSLPPEAVFATVTFDRNKFFQVDIYDKNFVWLYDAKFGVIHENPHFRIDLSFELANDWLESVGFSTVKSDITKDLGSQLWKRAPAHVWVLSFCKTGCAVPISAHPTQKSAHAHACILAQETLEWEQFGETASRAFDAMNNVYKTLRTQWIE